LRIVDLCLDRFRQVSALQMFKRLKLHMFERGWGLGLQDRELS